MKHHHSQWFNTYSIVALDQESRLMGVAVQTHQMSVGSVVPWLLPGIGALVTQSLTNVSFGPIGLSMLRAGVPAPKIVEALVASDPRANVRQFALVDVKGKVGAWTGESCIPKAGHHIGEGYSVQANMMVSERVVPAMAAAYESAEGELAERMLAALHAAQAEGGDIRGMQSAALKIVDGKPEAVQTTPTWRTAYDLRVDEHDDPVTELSRLVRLRSAERLDQEGFKALEDGQRDQALDLWAQARAKAPELEELSFWQAMELADKPADIPAAHEILKPMLSEDPRREYWIDLIRRIQLVGILEREGAASEIIAALESAS
jgi:uncharacterized Ntn-hydrolase superfamily protein